MLIVCPGQFLAHVLHALAYQALEADPDIDLLVPCDIVVRQGEDGSVTVAFMVPICGKLDQIRDSLRHFVWVKTMNFIEVAMKNLDLYLGHRL